MTADDSWWGLAFSRFFYECWIAALCTRLHLIHAVACDEDYARRMFKCYSAPARLRVIEALVVSDVVELT